MRDLDALNALPAEAAEAAFLRCCGSVRWAHRMAARRPFADVDAVLAAADAAADELTEADWLEAFAQHPRIGDLDALRTRFTDTRTWSADEQAGAAGASDTVLHALAEGNRTYETRFGFTFIVCATGRCADEMLDLLQARLSNDRWVEIGVAAAEQRAITRLRLDKLVRET